MDITVCFYVYGIELVKWKRMKILDREGALNGEMFLSK